jgi:hypothetical protein
MSTAIVVRCSASYFVAETIAAWAAAKGTVGRWAAAGMAGTSFETRDQGHPGPQVLVPKSYPGGWSESCGVSSPPW